MPPKILSQRRNEAFNVKTFDMKNVTFSYSQESVLFPSLAFLFGIRRGWIWILRIRYSNSFDPMACAIFALKYFHLAFPPNSHPVTMNWKINTKRNSISTSLFAIAFWWNQITVWECNDIIRRIDNQSDWLVSHRPKNKERINERKKNLIWFMIISPKKLITKARTCKADEVSPTFTVCFALFPFVFSIKNGMRCYRRGFSLCSTFLSTSSPSFSILNRAIGCCFSAFDGMYFMLCVVNSYPKW